MIRLLHVHSGNLFGGVETMLLGLKKAEPAELEQSYAVCWDGRLTQELRALGADVLRLPEVRLRSPLQVFRARASLRAKLHAVRPDVVLFHSAWTQLIFASEVTRAGIPFARYVHGIPSRTEWMDRLAMRRRPSLIISAGNYTGAIARRVYPRCEHAVVRYPVDVDSFKRDLAARARVRAELHVDDDTTVILQASRMEPWKGQRLHLQALARTDSTRRWMAWFAGGAQRQQEVAFAEELRQTARELKIDDKVMFLGQRSDMTALLSAADIFCQPNEGPEPFGIVFVEALAAGLPVVTTNLGGGAEILAGRYGKLVPRDANALAAALRSLIDVRESREALMTAAPLRARELCEPTRQAALLRNALENVGRR